MNNPSFYYDSLYPLQDAVLNAIGSVETEFYLSGGTAASRGYLHHRFSDDIDLFVNDDDRFGLWADRIFQALAHNKSWQSQVTLREERFARMNLIKNDVIRLKSASTWWS